MAEFWPADGRKEVNKKDGLWLRYRDETIGPFPNRTEASWYDGQIQEITSGWIDKSRFAGRIFPFGDVWYVERWEHNDGPFMSLDVAYNYREELYSKYREVIEESWSKKAQHKRVFTNNTVDDILSGPYGPGRASADDEEEFNFNEAKILGETKLVIPESLRTTADFGVHTEYRGEDGRITKVFNESGREAENATDELDLLQKAGFGVRGMKWGESGRKPKKATDDIVEDVTGEESIRRFIEENRDKVAEIMAESGGESENATDGESETEWQKSLAEDVANPPQWVKDMQESIIAGLVARGIYPEVFTRPTTEQKAEEVGKQIKEGFKQGMAESGYISENATDEGSKFGRLAESGKVQVDSEGKVVISGGDSGKSSDDMLVRTGWFERRNALLDEYAKNASDGEEALKNYQGYVIINTNGPTHIDPATGEPHRNDHICNHQCRALAKKAREEYQAELRQNSWGMTGPISKEALAGTFNGVGVVWGEGLKGLSVATDETYPGVDEVSQATRDHIVENGQVSNPAESGKITSDDRIESLEKPRKTSSFWTKAMDALDESTIVEVNSWGMASKIHPKALRDIEEQFGVHIDPATGEPHRNDHICAPICKVLADKAHFELELREAEYLEAKARTDLEAARMKVAVFKDKLQAVKDQIEGM
jgi:hypothetical protein